MLKASSILFLSFVLGLAGIAAGASKGNNEQDVSFKIGGSVGSIHRPERNGVTDKTFQVGGLPLGIAWNHDASFHLSTTINAQLMIDVPNSQVMRQGVEGGMAYHILGGARRIVNNASDVRSISTSPFNLSLLGRMGIFNYSASTKNKPVENVAGSVLEARTGIEYRKDLSEVSALGTELLATLFTLPASTERLAPRFIEWSFFWRMYF